MKMKKMKIIFRSCTRIKNVTAGSGKRPLDLNKKEITLACLRSLLESCSKIKNKKICLEVVDDLSEKEIIKEMKKILQEYKINFKFHEKEFKNNGLSMKYSYEIADKSKEDLIFFYEDDYLILPETIREIFYCYDKKILKTNNFAIFPVDIPRHYVKLFPSYIFLGRDRYWRSTPFTTGTFLIPKKLFKKYRGVFSKFAAFNIKGHGGEMETISRLWQKKIPCVSPIPTLGAHLHKPVIPKFIHIKNFFKKE